MPSWTQVCITERRAKAILDALRDRGRLRFFAQRSSSPSLMFYSDPQRVLHDGIHAEMSKPAISSDSLNSQRIFVWDTHLQPPPRLEPSSVQDFFVPGGEFIEIMWSSESKHGCVGLFNMTVHPPSGIIFVGGEPYIARKLIKPTTEWIRRLMKHDTQTVPGEYMRISPECVRCVRDMAKPPAWLDRLGSEPDRRGS
jgi:hypothetical protein